MSLRRKILNAVVGAIVAWLILCAIAGVMATDWALYPLRRKLTLDDQKRALTIAENHHAILRQVQTSAADGTPLRAWQIVPQSANGDAVILLHGMADNRAGMLGDAEMLLRHGYSVLLPDARAQGMSDGTLATYGFLEAGDLQHWFNWLTDQQSQHCIYAIGESMGAAQLLGSLSESRAFCAVAAESSFASFARRPMSVSASGSIPAHGWVAPSCGL